MSVPLGTKNHNKERDMSDLISLKSSIIADGRVDADEVIELRTVLLADGTIDRDEADTLFEINDAVSGANNDPSWPVFFSEALSSHVLEDAATPGIVSAEEASYLKGRIHKDGNVDSAERRLLETLKNKAQAPVPAELTFLFDMYLA
jgi:hypothetical protein